MNERRSMRVFVAGKVQGVGFRAFVAHEASRRPVDGHVRNLADGRVEAVFSGAADDVAALCEACARGPYAARVDGMQIVEAQALAPGSGFCVLREGA
jgi:acylphosphatase